MALSRERIVEHATALVGDQGLAGLSMRRLADDLGVRPGALYYHIPSKQDLLVAIAAHILDTAPEPIPVDDARRAAGALRSALLRVRDGAELVSFAHAFRAEALGPCRDLHRAFADRLGPPEARWAAQTVVHYVLGFVASEQNHAELRRTRIVDDEDPDGTSEEAFGFGLRAILRGIDAAPGEPA